MKAKKWLKTLGICGLAAVLMFSFATLFLTDSDNATNEFTIGDISIELTEPSWDPDDGDGVVPNQPVDKDPTVQNVGENDALIYVAVSIPTANVVLVEDDGTPAEEATLEELFTIVDVDENWEFLEKDDTHKNGTATEQGYVTYVYSYSVRGKMTPVAPNEYTEAVFAQVKMINCKEDPALNGAEEDIVVQAFAIQSDWFGMDQRYSRSIWDILANQRGLDITFPELVPM